MKEIDIPIGNVILKGNLEVPNDAKGIVLFAHGSGSSRFSKRNNFVAGILNKSKIATLLFDLLTKEEEMVDEQTREFRFDIPLLAKRLVEVTKWVNEQEETKNLSIGYFGASTGGGAALIAASTLPDDIKAVVSRGGRPDLAIPALPKVKAPTLLIVGGNDEQVIEMNQEALKHLKVEKKLEIVPGATHLFEEPGKLEEVARLAADWFVKYLNKDL